MPTISHQQALDKLAAHHLVQVIEDDVASLTSTAMSYAKHDQQMTVAGYVLPLLLGRWNCVLNASNDEVSPGYQDKTALALALLLHKHGIAEPAITQRALQSIDKLNAAVALSDAFFRNTDAIKALLTSPAQPLKKRPSTRDSLTFLRARDVIAIQLEQYYYAAYVHEITGFNAYPIVEFYHARFEHRPDMTAVQGCTAQGETYNDGKTRVSLHAVIGMRHVPDLANQFHLIATGIAEKPDQSRLAASVGLHTISDLFQLQGMMRKTGI